MDEDVPNMIRFLLSAYGYEEECDIIFTLVYISIIAQTSAEHKIHARGMVCTSHLSLCTLGEE
jgi:hypothetical protein